MKENSDFSIGISAFWLAGILFTNGYLNLSGIKILWSIFLWAYYLGQKLGGII